MANRKVSLLVRLVAGTSALIFILLSLFSIGKAQSGVWHGKCVELWQKQQWPELTALAENLYRLGKRDPESLFFGVLACRQLQLTEESNLFSTRLLQQRILHLRIESDLSDHFRPANLRQQIQLFRTRLVIGLLVCLLFVSLQSIKSERWLHWVSLLSALGCIILLS